MSKVVDLTKVQKWLGVAESEVRTAMYKGGSAQQIASLQGSLAMVTALEKAVTQPIFVAAAPTEEPEPQPTPVNLSFMRELDEEKVSEYLTRVKEEATNRGLPDVVGFVQAMELHLTQGAFLPKHKTYAVPLRDGSMNATDALSKIKNEGARLKYLAIWHVFEVNQRGYTDDEMRKALADSGHGIVPGTVTAYRGDLVRAGWLRYAGETRRGESGSSMKVWEITP